MIPYDRNVPADRGDSLSETQPQLLNNFETLFNAFLRNHISLDAASNAGNHTVIELLRQQNALQTNLNEFSIYAKNVVGQTDQVFMRFQSNGLELQFTNYQIYSTSPSNFFTFLPGNIIVYFGRIPLGNPVFDLIPTVATNIFSVSLCGTIGSTRYKPLFNLVTPSDGYVKTIFLTTPVNSISNLLPMNYIIMGNFGKP